MMKRLALILALFFLLSLAVGGTTYAMTPLSGDNVRSQPAGSLDISNQAQLIRLRPLRTHRQRDD